MVLVSFTDLGGTKEAPLASVSVTYENTAATGVPTITGTAQVGEELTAHIDNIADADGLADPPMSLMYQWKAATVDIEGAPSANKYTVGPDDVGKSISVAVTFNDDRGMLEEPLPSVFTSVVPAEPTENTAATGVPTIVSDPSTDVVAGSVLTANIGFIVDVNGLETATFTYQWLADDVAIARATEATYTVRVADRGKPIKVRVTFTDDDGYEEKLTSAATTVVANPSFRP